MTKKNHLLTDAWIKRLEQEVAAEFPDDPALQQVHLSRKILAREAKQVGLSYLTHIRQIARQNVLNPQEIEAKD